MLTDAEILALAVPVVSSAVVMLAAWVEVRLAVRQRERRKQQQTSLRHADIADDVLLEIDPQLLQRAQVGDRLRYFVRADALRALIARDDRARPDAAE
jgi:flagellar biosynthesis/type III secretory pathway M-ring protein FliF/YscJ